MNEPENRWKEVDLFKFITYNTDIKDGKTWALKRDIE